MKKSYNFIFIDINNIIFDEKTEIKDGDELKKEIKEKFEFIDSIINHFIENQILIDIEKEENYLFKKSSFIYQIENGIMKKFQFLLFRKIMNNIFNIEIDAIFIVLDLEKGKDEELLNKLVEKIINNPKIKLYFLGIYKSKNNIELKRENIFDIFIDIDQQVEHKYTEININNEDKDEINEAIDKFIEEAMFDVYISEKEINFEDLKKGASVKDIGENNSISGCVII